MSLKRALVALLFGPALLLFTAARSDASSITFQLDCYFNGSNQCVALGFSYGTVTISDDGGVGTNQVSVTADITGTALTLKSLYLNYSFDANSGSTLTSSNGTLAISQNLIQADGYSVGKFDIQFPSDPSSNSINQNLYVTLLTATTAGATLDPADFDLLTTNNVLYVAAHVGNTNCNSQQIVDHSCTPSTAQGTQSLFVGTTSDLQINQLAAVPEPASVVLLGTGLFAAAAFARRRRKA